MEKLGKLQNFFCFNIFYCFKIMLSYLLLITKDTPLHVSAILMYCWWNDYTFHEGRVFVPKYSFHLDSSCLHQLIENPHDIPIYHSMFNSYVFGWFLVYPRQLMAPQPEKPSEKRGPSPGSTTAVASCLRRRPLGLARRVVLIAGWVGIEEWFGFVSIFLFGVKWAYIIIYHDISDMYM